MASTTDTFMTAAVVMATAPAGQVHQITNIANQRVKECDRIAAMVKELGKCGVTCRELETGIEIEAVGTATTEVLRGVGADIHCYNDHRIAMSFGVLGCRWSGVHVTDQACTDKTYPGFWDDWCLHFQGSIKPWLGSSNTSPSQSSPDSVGPSLFIIGMRGCGKSTLGAEAARALGYRFIDADDRIAARCPDGSIKSLVEKEGWPAFRSLETDVLVDLLANESTGAVIACGGGVVGEEANRRHIKESGAIVAWLKRDFAEIEAYLEAEGARPAYGESVADVYQRRLPLYAECSTHELEMPAGTTQAVAATAFSNFAAVITKAAPPPVREGTFFLSLTFPDLASVDAKSLIRTISHGAHALELRVDLLRSQEPANVARQVAILRASSPLPVIFTVRSAAEGGGFRGTEEEYFALNQLAVRLGCEWIDVEACWSEAGRKRFASRLGGSRAIGSAHFQKPCPGVIGLEDTYRKCWLGGAMHVVKVIYT